MTIQELIESNSRKPMVELLKEAAHLRFDDEKYASRYCEAHCPHIYADYYWECPGGCRTWDDGMTEGHQTVYGADMLIGEILRNGYQVLEISGVNKPFRIDDSGYTRMDWEKEYDRETGFCTSCEYYGKSECPEDILSAECPKSGDAWAIERITNAVNEVLVCSL